MNYELVVLFQLQETKSRYKIYKKRMENPYFIGQINVVKCL